MSVLKMALALGNIIINTITVAFYLKNNMNITTVILIFIVVTTHTPTS